MRSEGYYSNTTPLFSSPSNSSLSLSVGSRQALMWIPLRQGRLVRWIVGLGMGISVLLFLGLVMPHHVMQESRQIHVFYHAFSPGERGRTSDVVNEQISTLLGSPLGAVIDNIHVTVVGPDWEWARDNLRWSNDERHTFSRESGPEGWEGATLSLIHEHCHERSNDIVVYMHTKGLYHPRPHNEILRRWLMRGITSPCCLDALTSSDGRNEMSQFNVCGLRFCPEPNFHFDGNMWMARCDYIRDLYPPQDMPRRMDEVLSDLYWAKGRHNKDWYHGYGRHSYEHWVASHPSLRALDVLPASSADDFFCAGGASLIGTFEKITEDWIPQCASAPRSGTGQIPFNGNLFLKCLSPELRMREYMMLYGEEEMKMQELKMEGSTDDVCQSSACTYYARGAKLIEEYGRYAIPCGSVWLDSWSKFVSPMLACPSECRMHVETGNVTHQSAGIQWMKEPIEPI
jgi:hypothetical protein